MRAMIHQLIADRVERRESERERTRRQKEAKARKRADRDRERRRDRYREELNDALISRSQWGFTDTEEEAAAREEHIIFLIRELEALDYDLLIVQWTHYKAATLLIRALPARYVIRDSGAVERRRPDELRVVE